MSFAGTLTCISRAPVRKRHYWYPTYQSSKEFTKPWWGERYSNEPPLDELWWSIMRGDLEVARCKYVTRTHPTDPALGDLPHGQIDILAFEVATSMRRQGIGRAALQAIRDLNPLPRLTALNDDAESRKFWDGIGWIRHEHPNPFFAGIERVTYSEI